MAAAAGLKRHRLTLEVTFASENDKKAFQEKLDAAKRLILPLHQRDTHSFLNAMLDRILATATTSGSVTSIPPVVTPIGNSFLDTSGMYPQVV